MHAANKYGSARTEGQITIRNEVSVHSSDTQVHQHSSGIVNLGALSALPKRLNPSPSDRGATMLVVSIDGKHYMLHCLQISM